MIYAVHEKLAGYNPAYYTAVLTAMAKEYKPEVILVAASAQGAEFAPAVSARLKTGLAAHCTELKIDENEELHMTDDDLIRAAAAVKAAANEMEDAPTEFEIITAMAFWYFARQHCSIVVLEVGLGGRLDATNVIPVPEVAVIMMRNGRRS